jgi:uncharacterized protein (TIGR03437 family)
MKLWHLVRILVVLGAAGELLEAQMPPVVLHIDSANFVRYDQETADWTKYATSPGIVTLAPGHLPPFGSYITLGDLVSVNGKPVKGVRVLRGLNTNFAINAMPKQAVADIGGSTYFDQLFVIQNLDGTVIGTIVVTGQQITDPAPAASGLGGWGQVVVGGSGAFLGVTGQGCGVSGGTPPGGARVSSVTEDPANRRINGGGATYSVLCLIPGTRPLVVTNAAGPAIVHSNDYSLVTSAKPAKPGEILTLFASGLGPTLPGVDPGQPFTADPRQLVIAPVEVLVNGKSSQVLYAGGYPGAVDGYQVNFQVPDSATPGMASVQMTSAWIPGPEVKMVIQ